MTETQLSLNDFFTQEIQYISPGEINNNEFQPRTSYDETTYEELKKSIFQTNGNIEPVILWKKDGHYITLSGHRRVSACQSLLLDVSSRIIVNISEQQAWEIAITTNTARHDLASIDLIRAVAKLASFGYSISEIAKKIGMSRGAAHTYFSCSTVEQSVTAKIISGEVSISTAAIISKLPPTAQNDILQRILNQNYNRAESRQLVNLWLKADDDIRDQIHAYVPLDQLLETFQNHRIENMYTGKMPKEYIHRIVSAKLGQWHNESLDQDREKYPEKTCDICGDVIYEHSQKSKHLITCKVCGLKYCSSQMQWHFTEEKKHLALFHKGFDILNAKNMQFVQDHFPNALSQAVENNELSFKAAKKIFDAMKCASCGKQLYTSATTLEEVQNLYCVNCVSSKDVHDSNRNQEITDLFSDEMQILANEDSETVDTAIHELEQIDKIKSMVANPDDVVAQILQFDTSQKSSDAPFEELLDNAINTLKPDLLKILQQRHILKLEFHASYAYQDNDKKILFHGTLHEMNGGPYKLVKKFNVEADF